MTAFSWNNRQFCVVLPNGWTVSTIPDGPWLTNTQMPNHTNHCEVWARPPEGQPQPDEYSDPERKQTPAEWFAYLTKVAAL